MEKRAIGGQGPALMAVGWSESVLGTLIIGLRLYGASKKAGEIRWDFVWIALAWACGVASNACFTVSISFGMGNHLADIPLQDIFTSLEWVWITIFTGLLGLVFAKWAVVALLLQIQLRQQVKRRIFLWSLAIILGVSSFAQIPITLTQCHPTERLWNLSVPGDCPGRNLAVSYGYYVSALHVAFDFILAIYPITIVWDLQTNFKLKVGFCILMAGGIIPGAAGIAKAIMLRFLTNPSDITYQFAPFMVWAATELWFVIILGSIPPLRPLFLRFFRKAATTLTSSHGTRHQGRSKTGALASTANGTRSGMQLQSFKSFDNKGRGVQTYTSQVMTNGDSSEENILRSSQHGVPQQHSGDGMGRGLSGLDQIVVSREYEVESRRVQSGIVRDEDLERGGYFG